MKHYMQPRTAILRENDVASHSHSHSPSSAQKSKQQRKQHKGSSSSKENAPPVDANTMSPAPPVSAKMRSPLPPRPPPSSCNPLKRKLSLESAAENSSKGSSDSGVKVIVRMRPLVKEEEEGDLIVNKVSSDSLSINGHTFTFDSVADIGATQQDIFQLIGAPLVENCLAGFNSSVFAYGQTGSGKTYTMWGPANALLEQQLSSDQQGLTPRVLERLFARINEEQIKHSDKQLKYQCRCSFLEIYNEQITDLLDPTQRNLQIREDVKSGVYVENLTEECVCSMKDVTQLLIKGISNRRTGATSINADSSRSHCVFTCIVESRYKNNEEGISSLRTSRINLVDLAGSERQKSTGAAGERLKEAGNINRSLSQLGNLINILADVSQTGKQRHIPYRDSRLTFLLQESLGGNAKLAMICAISPAQRCKSETFSTLRFAQRAKAIKNKAVVNEAMDDDVNVLRDIIRQLKDELLRMKSAGNNPAGPSTGYTPGFVRRSLHLLKYSLNRPMTLPHDDDDDDDAEMEIDEEGVEKLCNQVDKELIRRDSSKNGCREQSEDTDVEMEESEQFGKQAVSKHETEVDQDFSGQLAEDKVLGSSTSLLGENLSNIIRDGGNLLPLVAEEHKRSSSTNPLKNSLKRHLDDPEHVELPCTLIAVMCDASPDLKSPTPSLSPRVTNTKKSISTSSMLTASQKACKDENKPGPGAVHLSFLKTVENHSSNVSCNQTSKKVRATTEHLAASLHHGLEVIDFHRQRSPLRLSPFRSSYKPTDLKPLLPVEKVNVGVQTFPQDDEALQEDIVVYLCNKCKSRSEESEVKEDNDVSNMQLVPVDGDSAEKFMKQVPKAVEKVLAGSFRREMALEEFCAKQASELAQLNRLVQQYKHERECNAVIAQTREDKILRLESLVDGILPTEEFMEEEFVSLRNEHKLLQETYENHPEVLRTKVELQKVQDQLENYRNFFDLGEKEVLIEEIHDLRSQLQYYIDSSSAAAQKRSPQFHLTYPSEPSSIQALETIPEFTAESAEEKFGQERNQWAEAEGKWIALAEELRTELEDARSLSEKRKQELDSEKRFAEELKEALQLAMQGHARMLEQYADLEEKHMQLLARHRRIREGIDDVKRAASRAGVRGAESKFINALAAEISALKAEREKERRYLRDENKGLQAQLRDTAEAVQAAGELLVRLKEAEEAVAVAQNQALEAKKETEKSYKKIDKLERKYEKQISQLQKQLLAESRLPKEKSDADCDSTEVVKYGEEFEPFSDDIEDKLGEPTSWFSGYDRCNI